MLVARGHEDFLPCGPVSQPARASEGRWVFWVVMVSVRGFLMLAPEVALWRALCVPHGHGEGGPCPLNSPGRS